MGKKVNHDNHDICSIQVDKDSINLDIEADEADNLDDLDYVDGIIDDELIDLEEI